MALKVDSEKAYYRVRWDFLEDTMVDVGFPSVIIHLIMSCVTSSSMQVLWNGSIFDQFCPTCGLRQGDPISPYFYVLCMEWFGHVINNVVDRHV